MKNKHTILHERALTAAKTYHQSVTKMLEILIELDTCKTFLHFECASLFQYCIRHLGLSEDVALNFIAVARKSKLIPELKIEIEGGTLTVTKARKIASVITSENKYEWIDRAKTLPQKQLERAVAMANPKEAVTERVTYVTESRLKLELGVSERFLTKLKRVQDLLAQRRASHQNREETLEAALDFYLEKNDPIKKAERAQARTAKYGRLQTTAQAAKPKVHANRKPIPAPIKHAGVLRDSNQCTHRDTSGQPCGESRWIHLHHKTPVSRGGTNSAENLVTLCSTHHRILHRNQSAHPSADG